MRLPLGPTDRWTVADWRAWASAEARTDHLHARITAAADRFTAAVHAGRIVLDDAALAEVLPAEAEYLTWLADGTGAPDAFLRVIADRMPGALRGLRLSSYGPPELEAAQDSTDDSDTVGTLPDIVPAAPVEPVADLPDRLYHGSRDLARVLTRGLETTPVGAIRNDVYAFTSRDPAIIAWGPWLRRWHRSLTPAARRALARQYQPVRGMQDLADLGLVWCHTDPTEAAAFGDGVAIEIDPRAVRLYGYFEADEASRHGEVVLVCPVGRVAGPEAITAVRDTRTPDLPLSGRRHGARGPTR